MIEIKSQACDNKTGIAYLSDEIYELIVDESSFKKGDKVRLITDINNVESLGFHDYDLEDWVVVCGCGREFAEYCGVPKVSLRLVKGAL